MRKRRKRGETTSTNLDGLGFRTVAQSPRRIRARRSRSLLNTIVFASLFAALLILLPGILLISLGNFATQWWANIPSEIPEQELAQHSVILDKNGKQFARFFAENRVPVSFDEIPENLKEAIIATEDQRFYTHNGVDWRGTARAALAMIEGDSVQGGSGITQQYVKNLLVSNATTKDERESAIEQTLDRKVVEAKTAIEIEKEQTKDEILTGYLNTVYFGDNAYGIGAASKHYFDKKPIDLTVPEAALLAGIVNSPTAYNPVENPNDSRVRRNHVLYRMLDEGYITQAEYDKYSKQKVKLALTQESNGCAVSKYPFYCSWVREILANNSVFGKTPEARAAFVRRGGLTIRTALDPKIMSIAQSVARDSLNRFKNPATGIAVVEPGTGLVPAIATNRLFGRGPGKTEIVYPVMPVFQPGSTFKPLTAAAAIESGVSPDLQMLAPSSYEPPDRNAPPGGFTNAGDSAGGDYNMAGAMKNSVNTWFVMLEDRIGVRKTAETAARMGMSSLPLSGDNAITEKDASLTLGSYETSPLELASAYATIAAHGITCNPIAITSIISASDKPVEAPPADCRRTIRQSTADTVAQMMTGVISSEGTGKAANFGKPAAGKTGTTDNASAVWFAGFTPQYSTAVWIGDPRGGIKYPLNSLYARGEWFSPVYGGGAPALVWRDVMKNIHAGLPVEKFSPSGGETSVGIPYTIPNVVGLSPEEATQVLAESGFKTSISTNPGPDITGIPKGRITEQEPRAGSVVEYPGRTIIVKLK